VGKMQRVEELKLKNENEKEQGKSTNPPTKESLPLL
jgi:hypothetical protein